MSSTPDSRLSDALRRFGTTFGPEELAATRALYRPHLDLTPADIEDANVEYGPHARHRLDVYRPAGTPRGIVVYVHGGGFIAGSKNGDGTFYVNIGRWLARNGYVAVLPNYRLAPGDGWPAGAVDLQAALQWVAEQRASLAAPSAPLVLWGQSAGASHAATWLFDDGARGADAVRVDAVMLMSGFYIAEAPLPHGPIDYFGDDASLYARRSPLQQVRPTKIPLWLSVAELDPDWIGFQTYALAAALMRANGRSPDFHFCRGHNHVSTVQSLGSPQHDVADEILRFLATVAP